MFRPTVRLRASLPLLIRSQAIPCLLQGRNVVACAPTGSGKTAAFVLPMLALLQESKSSGFRALIVTPTRELAKQIHTEILLLGGQRRFKTMLLTKANFATLSHETERNDAMRHDILITTPQVIHIAAFCLLVPVLDVSLGWDSAARFIPCCRDLSL
jgi:ATP-dependent RNA helicase DDX52/ROK1